jgi:hypothetical protein
MICLHDETMAETMNQKGLKLRDEDSSDSEPLFGTRRPLMLLLSTALARRHRRIWHIYGLRGNPMSDYLKDTLTMEKEHTSEIAAMIDSML